jgi:hypothetical protein
VVAEMMFVGQQSVIRFRRPPNISTNLKSRMTGSVGYFATSAYVLGSLGPLPHLPICGVMRTVGKLTYHEVNHTGQILTLLGDSWGLTVVAIILVAVSSKRR